MNTLDAALAYAGRNSFAVFPCLPRAKEPAVKRGFYAATTNPETIRRFWRVADRNIAIRTGMASRVWILDVDGEDGEASLRSLEAKHGALPPTWESLTARGRHIWFRCDCPVPCSASKIAPGLDARGDGGYVVAPPSIHPSGRVYVWSVDRADDLANAPDWLLRLARKKPASTISERAIANMQARRGACPSPYGEAALDYECVALAATAPGGRNHALNCAAFALFQLVAGGELAHEHVFDRLVDACHRNGLVADDGMRSVMATIQSGRRAGLQLPARARRIMSAPELRPYQHDVIDEFDRRVEQQVAAASSSWRRPARARPLSAPRSSAGRSAREDGARARASARDHHPDEPETTRSRHRARHYPSRLSRRPLEDVQVASIQTLHRRAIHAETMDLPPAHLLVIDEAHHCPANTYRKSSKAIPRLSSWA